VNVNVRLFGLGTGDASRKHLAKEIASPVNIRTLWLSLQSEGQPDEKLAQTQPEALLVLVNGTPIHLLEDWDTPLCEGDTVLFMRMAVGG
jgi:hypothetical protein